MADEVLLANLEARRSFLASGERVLFAKRKHWYILFLRICTTSALGLFFALTSFFLFSLFRHPTLFMGMAFFVVLLTVGLITKGIIDWYCHFYVVTTRKILEVCLAPLFSDKINEILLDQVRCTEVDTERRGMLRELLDVGNVTITFDRPTHQQEVVFVDIKDSEQAGVFLSDVLVGQSIKNKEESGMWFRAREEKNNPHRFRFTEEVFPGETIGVN